MMRKRIYIFCLALSMLGCIAQSNAQRARSEVAFGYGYFSLFSLAHGVPYNASSGAYSLTYRYYLTKDVTIGLSAATENIKNYASFTSIAPEVTVAYLDTRHARVRVRLYGSIAYGVAIENDNDLALGQLDNSGVKAYGLWACPLGMRLGRQFAFFTEVGVGYKGLFHMGFDFRFPRVLAANRHRED